jgi:hypothetical protein
MCEGIALGFGRLSNDCWRTCGTVLRVTGADADPTGPDLGVAGGACASRTEVEDGSARSPAVATTPKEGSQMSTRPQLLREFGRTEFTVRDVAERTGLSVEAARGRVARYLAADLVERTPFVQQYIDDSGRPTRGRPAHLYRVR